MTRRGWSGIHRIAARCEITPGGVTVIEAVNCVFQLAKRIARGFKNFLYF